MLFSVDTAMTLMENYELLTNDSKTICQMNIYIFRLNYCGVEDLFYFLYSHTLYDIVSTLRFL